MDAGADGGWRARGVVACQHAATLPGSEKSCALLIRSHAVAQKRSSPGRCVVQGDIVCWLCCRQESAIRAAGGAEERMSVGQQGTCQLSFHDWEELRLAGVMGQAGGQPLQFPIVPRSAATCRHNQPCKPSPKTQAWGLQSTPEAQQMAPICASSCRHPLPACTHPVAVHT